MAGRGIGVRDNRRVCKECKQLTVHSSFALHPRIVVAACFCGFYQKLKAFVSHYRLFSALSFRSHSSPHLISSPPPHDTHDSFCRSAVLRMPFATGTLLANLYVETLLLSTPSALLRNHSGVPGVRGHFRRYCSRTVPLPQISQRDTETPQDLPSVRKDRFALRISAVIVPTFCFF